MSAPVSKAAGRSKATVSRKSPAASKDRSNVKTGGTSDSASGKGNVGTKNKGASVNHSDTRAKTATKINTAKKAKNATTVNIITKTNTATKANTTTKAKTGTRVITRNTTSASTGNAKRKPAAAWKAKDVASTKKTVTANSVVINFGPQAIADVVSAKSKKIIEAVMLAAGVKAITISSTLRTAKDQARAMYDNLSLPGGVANARKLYKTAGQKIIAVYEQQRKEGKSANQIRAAMEKKINEIGPEVVTKHAKDPSKINVIDIAPSSVPVAKRAEFVAKMKDAKKQGKVTVFLEPGQGDPAYHIEIVQ